jgi:hypothetical protein
MVRKQSTVAQILRPSLRSNILSNKESLDLKPVAALKVYYITKSSEKMDRQPASNPDGPDRAIEIVALFRDVAVANSARQSTVTQLHDIATKPAT